MRSFHHTNNNYHGWFVSLFVVALQWGSKHTSRVEGFDLSAAAITTSTTTTTTPPVFQLLGGDVTSGIVAAATVAPWVASVDRAITLNAASPDSVSIREAFLEDIRETFQAQFFLAKPTVQWLWLVYGVTYIAANAADTLCQVQHVSPVLPVLWASTTANTVACIAKDAAFAKLYGGSGSTSTSASSTADNNNTPPPKAISKPVPTLSYVVWLLRDILTAFSAFTLPPILRDQWEVPTLASRFAGPVVAQYFTTPLHLTGLILYNDNDNNSDNNDDQQLQKVQRIVGKVRDKLPDTIVARQLRIIPGFSVGGICNSFLRDYFVVLLTAFHHQHYDLPLS